MATRMRDHNEANNNSETKKAVFGQREKRSLICFVLFTLLGSGDVHGELWPMHIVDASLIGADGVRLADFNDDGLMDIVTGWEESGVVRLYLHPGYSKVHFRWPSVTVGTGKSPEDAVPFDVDGDGQLEVVSCHEGKKRQVLVHRNTVGANNEQLLEKTNWQTERIAPLDGQMWMYATPIHLRRNKHGIVFGSKNEGATLTLLLPPKNNATTLKNWEVLRLRSAGWIMSIDCLDMDGDEDEDIVLSDRKGKQRGVYWLEQPDDNTNDKWKEHAVGGMENETLFIDPSASRILASSRNSVWFEFMRGPDQNWSTTSHNNPTDVPFGKAVARLNDGRIAMTANTAADKIKKQRAGIWIKHPNKPWQSIDTTPSVKFDRMELIDLDGDGDQDILTCEERQNLGVIWYENPQRAVE